MINHLAGVDEAGRGPLAGPVFAAAVILDDTKPIAGLADSKQLSAKRREIIAQLIKERAVAWSVAWASVAEIDSINILQASLLAMQRAVQQLTIIPDQVLIDGQYCPSLPYPVKAVVGGDRLIQAISAASIIAKVSRDHEMKRLHEIYPCYGFDRHKGYPTRAHLEALRQFGPSAIHRQTFSPVQQQFRLI